MTPKLEDQLTVDLTKSGCNQVSQAGGDAGGGGLLESSPFVEPHSVIDSIAIDSTTLNQAEEEEEEAEGEDEERIPQIVSSTESKSSKYFAYIMSIDYLSALYAATVASGGIFGYLKAGSHASLIAGLAFGGLLGVGAYLTSVNPKNYGLTLATSTALAGLMGYRFLNSHKFMPAGLMATLSIAMVLRYSYVYITDSVHKTK